MIKGYGQEEQWRINDEVLQVDLGSVSEVVMAVLVYLLNSTWASKGENCKKTWTKVGEGIKRLAVEGHLFAASSSSFN